ncbi:MAG: histidinol dehydrogenase [Lachnospiraceae bacterium]|nr:histidinol dehydrogenase [Lachnospiraceae bacterium]
MRITELNSQTKADILGSLLKRSPAQYEQYEQTVKEIVEDVKNRGDEAVCEYTSRFDCWEATAGNIKVTEEEIKAAYKEVDERFVAILKEAAYNIADFHERQKKESWMFTKEDGSILGQRITPIDSVGCYAPGGKAFYPSSVLMNIIPAKVAGVKRIVLATPAAKGTGKVNPVTLVAADIAGVNEIIKVGGAQAIAALAYGTATIPKVCKITGPGNIFVALAKKACFGMVGIDSIAGPSEILVIADESADPKFVAADLLSQAEHDEMASAILLTDSRKFADAVSIEADKFLEKLSRRDIISKSLENYGYILVGKTMDDVVEAANDIASEHVEIQTKEPYEVMTRIRNAGAIFIGPYSSEPLGDYFAGPNHILPTNGTARFFSPLNVDEFTKKTSLIAYSKAGLEAVHEKIEYFAEKEELTAHANSIRVRFED